MVHKCEKGIEGMACCVVGWYLELARGDALGLRELDGQVVRDDYNGKACCWRVCWDMGEHPYMFIGVARSYSIHVHLIFMWTHAPRGSAPSMPGAAVHISRHTHIHTVDLGAAVLHDADVRLLHEALHPLQHLVPPLVAVGVHETRKREEGGRDGVSDM